MTEGLGGVSRAGAGTGCPSRRGGWAQPRVRPVCPQTQAIDQGAGFRGKEHGEQVPEALEGAGGAEAVRGVWGSGLKAAWELGGHPTLGYPARRAGVVTAGEGSGAWHRPVVQWPHPVRRRWAEEVLGDGSAPC